MSFFQADASLELERRDFVRAGLEYVYLIQEVQERKKFEFVETLLGFMYSWLTFYHHGHEVAKDFKPHMTELQSRIQNVSKYDKRFNFYFHDFYFHVVFFRPVNISILVEKTFKH